ncbi:hypothetical protein OIU34_33690 [Pararhizobium sp. BT-229]|uniref:hypothetical protein n=1 Tax=Pararhizobium sp. BT-229 TaxID=2986923 RepID=UPI0021F6FBA2|nr:hypothetical protein [Pararhizobium sp. BT-229]MCV9966811.1 hypothetical protein [Pararhizobium sp. BT-229]
MTTPALPARRHGKLRSGVQCAGGIRSTAVEAWATIEACLVALQATADHGWIMHAQAAFAWYLGVNDLGLRIATAGGSRYGSRPNEIAFV